MSGQYEVTIRVQADSMTDARDLADELCDAARHSGRWQNRGVRVLGWFMEGPLSRQRVEHGKHLQDLSERA